MNELLLADPLGKSLEEKFVLAVSTPETWQPAVTRIRREN